MFTRLRQLVRPAIRELPPREAYRLWAPDYPPYPHNLLMEAEQRTVLAHLPDVCGKPALDLACGSGRYAAILAARGASVLALDVSFEMLARAGPQLCAVQGDLNALPLKDASVALVVCGLAVGHLEHLERALAEMRRVLAPGGMLVYSDFHAAGAALGWKRTFRANGRTYAVQHYPRTEQEHAALCASAGLQVEMVESVTIPVDPGNAKAVAFHTRWGNPPVALVVRAQRPRQTIHT